MIKMYAHCFCYFIFVNFNLWYVVVFNVCDQQVIERYNVNCYTCICFNAIFRKKMHCVSWQTCYKTFTYIFISKRYFYVWPDPKSCKIRKISVWIQFLKTFVNGFSMKIRNIIASITISDVTTVYAYNTQDKTIL